MRLAKANVVQICFPCGCRMWINRIHADGGIVFTISRKLAEIAGIVQTSYLFFGREKAIFPSLYPFNTTTEFHERTRKLK